MIELATGWQMDVERGPDWLFVRVNHSNPNGDAMPQLAERVWELMQQHLVNRVVLELDQLPLLSSYFVGQLVLLHKRVASHNGLLRVSGLSESNQEVLHLGRLEDRFPHYDSRSDAVRGHRPLQPR